MRGACNDQWPLINTVCSETLHNPRVEERPIDGRISYQPKLDPGTNMEAGACVVALR
jgi:hypothetical protein